MPVVGETTNVAGESRPSTMAREEARTVMGSSDSGGGGWRPSSMLWGVVVPVAKGAIVGRSQSVVWRYSVLVKRVEYSSNGKRLVR